MNQRAGFIRCGTENVPLYHRDGIDWYDAPTPRRLHRCKVQTYGHSGCLLIERCACGAIRLDRGRWSEKNQRK